MKYKCTNTYNQPMKVNGKIVNPGESIILPFKLEGFHIEQIEEKEEPNKKLKGGK
jgi:hypothetical protein